MVNIPINFRKSQTALPTYDFYDLINGNAYKRFYLVGAKTDSGNQFFITTDASYTSSVQNKTIALSGTTSNDTDFDITIKNAFTIAADDCIFRIYSSFSGSNDNVMTITVYHVTAGGTETSLGSAVTSFSNVSGNFVMKFALTQRTFSPG